jgi:aldehyde:ferredoxin oxidoreductase
MGYGYLGKILRVDLTQQSYSVEEQDDKFYRTYVGGTCLAVYYLLSERPAKVEPFDPYNLLVFASSPLVGSGIPGASRFTIAAISPLTGCYGEAEAGGWWSPELKRAGYDAILVEGKSEKPVYLWINDEKVEFRDATHLWGKITGEVQETIRKELSSPQAKIASIGPAGENLVRYACVVNNLKHTNGRSGMGAVMGSKNLKAVAVRGSKAVPFKDPEAIKELNKWYAQNFMNHPIERLIHDGGTIGWDITELDELGILPTRNFHGGSFEHANDICGETFHKTLFVKGEGCYACPVRCKRVAASQGPYKVDPTYGGPEYETAGAFGSLCAVSNLEAICKGHELCNKYTLDTISTGVTIAFAMECFENELLTLKDTDGLELRFGNDQAMIQMIEKIARREGIGDLLAEGCMRAAKKIGRGAEKFAMHVKGQEIAMHEPRGKASIGLAAALSSTGANHVEAPHDYAFREGGVGVADMFQLGLYGPIHPYNMTPEKVRHFAYGQMTWNVMNTLGMCVFTAGPYKLLKMDGLAKAMQAATGWDTSLWEIMKLGERSITIKRAISCREGISRKDDCLPDRFFEPLENGLLKGRALDRKEFEKALDLYYDMMGWDRKTTVPTPGKLVELDLGWVNKVLGQE